MKPYNQRLADAKAYNKERLKNLDTSYNVNQKFQSGQFVVIEDKRCLTDCTILPKTAVVLYSYAQMYGGNDFSSYAIDIAGEGHSAWHNESELKEMR